MVQDDTGTAQRFVYLQELHDLEERLDARWKELHGAYERLVMDLASLRERHLSHGPVLDEHGARLEDHESRLNLMQGALSRLISGQSVQNGMLERIDAKLTAIVELQRAPK